MQRFDYGRMQATATRLMTRFAQGEITITRTSNAAGSDPWDVGAPTTETVKLEATAKAVEEKYVDGTLILGNELQITFAVPTFDPGPGDTFTVDGERMRVKKLMQVPAVGTPVDYVVIVH